MKQRTNLRMILIFCMMVLAILLIGSTKVNAQSSKYGIVTSGTITENDIPDTFNIDIKEVEFEKAQDMVFNQLVAILQSKGFVIDIYSWGNDIDYSAVKQQANGKDYIYVWTYDLKKVSISNSSNTLKEVNVIYNNSNQYNAETKKAVEQKANNLNLPKDELCNYYKCIKEIELGDMNAWGDWWYSYATENLTKAFNDSSITVLQGYDAKGDGPDPFEDGMDTPYYIFKDGVYYTTISAMGGFTSKITVPSNVEDIEAYAISRIKDYMKTYTEEFGDYCDFSSVKEIRLSKVKGDTYKVALIDKDGIELEGKPIEISIRKDTSTNTGNTGTTETKPITKEDKTTGIKIEAQVGSISVNITISSNKVTDQAIINKVADALKNISNKYVTYDISLLENGTKVQPNGKIKVSIPIPSGYDTSKLVVYRVTESGEKIEYKPTISGNYAVFETDHFSTYVLAETGTVKAPSQDKPNTSASDSNKLDDTPKTGVNNVILVSSAIVSIISLAGIIIIKRK